MIDRPAGRGKFNVPMTQSTPTLELTTAALYGGALSALSLPPSTCPLIPPPASIPHFKIIPKTRFVVDGFKYADSSFSISYFLTHFHSDHYTGLSPQWSKGIIYCSYTTANLLHQVLGIPIPFINALPLSQSVVIDGAQVWLVDANHCPGAVQFLFKVPVNSFSEGGTGSVSRVEKYVHTGDFRYSEEMKNERVMSEFIGADGVFLDTTYCNPKFVFPSQEESIDYIVGVIEKFGAENEGTPATNVLFLVATYVIGKEKILMEISRRCKRKIHVSDSKMAVLRALDLGESGVFTENELESNVHVVGWNVLGETWPYFRPNFVKMKEIMSEKGYSRVVGFVPTGWTYEIKRNKFSVRVKDSFEIHLVPYSEHSNYNELREYVKFLKPKRVVPTVGSDIEKIDSKKAKAVLKHFAGLVDEMAIKLDFLTGFRRSETGGIDVEKGSPFVSNNIPEPEDVTLSVSNCSHVVEPKSSVPLPRQEPASCVSVDMKENDLEKSLQELRECLPNWVTHCQMLDLLSGSGGDAVEAVSKFYEHETEFREEILPSTSFACMSESQPLLPSESHFLKSINGNEILPLSRSFKLSSSVNLKKSEISPAKRKKNIGNKSSKRARVDSVRNSKGQSQHLITKFFNRRAPLVSVDSKVEVDANNSCEDQNPTELFLEEVNQFLQIVNGGESLRGHAATILERTRGDISRALDIYYNDVGSANKVEKDMLEINRGTEPSTICSIVSDAEPSESNKLGSKSGILCPALPKKDLSVNYISLPPERYFPTEHACWRKGHFAPYIHIARTFELVEEENGKLKTASMLCNMFRSLLALSPEDLLPAVYLCTNKIAPDHENMELNIGGNIVVAALEEACGTNRSKIYDLYNVRGDLGDVAQLCRQTQPLLAPHEALTIRGVYSILRMMSVQTGNGSTARKKNLIVNLMRSCREKEMKFLVRTLASEARNANQNWRYLRLNSLAEHLLEVRNLRIGAMVRTVLPALAQAIVMHSAEDGLVKNLKGHIQSLSSAVVEAYNILPNFNLIIPSLMEKGIAFTSSTLSMVPGIPIKPMLAKITNGLPQVLQIFGNKAFTCEYKYDGQRAQIHRLTDGSIRVFSRNGEETTLRFPDVVDIVKDCCLHEAVTFILDSEVVAIDRKNNLRFMSFQELSSRDRGSKDSLVAVDKIKVDICIFVFDVMFANGEQLLNVPLRQRRKYLENLLREEKPGYFEYASEITVEAHDAGLNDEAALNRIKSFLDDALHSSCEGIMVKSLDVEAGYSPSKRSNAWLKVKRDYVDGLSDSLDLVPIGAWHGNGRKAGWYSPFLMACYNPDAEEFQSVCRVMSGFSDTFYVEMKEFFSGDRVLSKRPPFYQTIELPDMWFSPELVWEIRGADFTVSPVHHAAIGLVHASRGISVRFPRFLRSRPDKKPVQCSTAADIADMFNSQTRKMDVRIKE